MNEQNRKYLVAILILSATALTVMVFNYLRESIYRGENITSQDSGRKELTVVHWINIPEAVIDAFEREFPEIKVKYYKYHKQSYNDAISSRKRSGLPLDVVGISQENFIPMCEEKELLDLINKAFLQLYKNDVRAVINERTPEHEYAVGLSSTYYGIWYNKTLFKKYGLEVPATYDELTNICDILRKNKERTIAVLGTDERLCIPRNLIGSDRTSPVSKGYAIEENTKLNFLVNETDIDLQLSYQQAFKEFKRGKYPMLAMPNESMQMCGWDMERVFEPGVFAIPFMDALGTWKTPVILADNLIGVTSKTNRKEESFLFLNFLSRSDIARMLAKENGWISTVIAAGRIDIPYYSEWENLVRNGFCDISDN